MELRKALAMFRLTGRVPVEELNGTFRDLVKKYHPDKVREHPEWAHERMAEINTAYETLVEWLASPEVADPEKPVDESHRTPAANEPESEDEDHPYHRLLPCRVSWRTNSIRYSTPFWMVWACIFNTVLNG